MQVRAITRFLESIAPLAYQESYDNAGLIVGEPNMEVTKVLICLDCIEEIVDEAIENGCNLIVAHHPIVFGGLKKFNGKNYVERVVMKAIKNDIAIYAAHTNLDNVKQGVNKKIAERLGLKDIKILAPKKQLLKKLITFCPNADAEKVRSALFSAGAGHIGDYSETSFNSEGTGTFKGGEETNPHVGEKGQRHQEPETKIETIFPAYIESGLIKALKKAHPYEEVAYDIVQLDNRHADVGSGMVGVLSEPMDELAFLKGVKEQLKTDCIRHTKLFGKAVKRVAVCGGAGSFLLNSAIGAGADVFITGDYKYHQFFDAEDKIIIADVGHFESEQYTSDLFREILTGEFADLPVQITAINTNPVHYL